MPFNSIKKTYPLGFSNKESISAGISRQYRSFLMLELLIALSLIATIALPLSQFPLQAAQEELKSAYRMHAQRLADLAFADIVEQLHKEKISWQEIAKPKHDRATVLDRKVDVSFDSTHAKKFSLLGTLYSVGKKGQNAEEWRLATFCVKITPEQKKTKLFRTKKNSVSSRVFTYQVLLHKTATPVPTPTGMG